MSSNPFLMTKIIATLGPATSEIDIIKKLIESGVRVFRINFSHGSFEEYDRLIANVVQAREDTDTHVGILGDLSGPKIRVGNVIKSGVQLKEGEEVIFTQDTVIAGTRGYENVFSTTYPNFIQEVQPGERILLDDGNLELEPVKKVVGDDKVSLVCRVLVGGLLTSSKGINLPDTTLSLPAMTEKDFRCAEYAVRKQLDFLALSFVRTAEDIRTLKAKLFEMDARPKGLERTAGDLGFSTTFESNYIPIISKIEKPQAIDNLDEIVEETDGVMVARGDLGVEMDLAEVALIQKKIITKCLHKMKPVIVATQMLQSMINEPVPTRAEVSDVANAIMDGADAVMLSGETAIGKYPVQTVKMMNRVALKTAIYITEEFRTRGKFMPYEGTLNNKAAMARSVHLMARDIQAKFIITWTHSGGSTVFLSQQRMEIPIIACGENRKRLNQMSILYSITPVYMKQPKSGSRFIRAVNRLLLKNKWAKKGEKVVVVASSPITKRGITNRVVIHEVGEAMEE